MFFAAADQCDHIGLLSKSLGEIIYYKNSPKIGHILCYFKNLSFNIKTASAAFLGNFGEN